MIYDFAAALHFSLGYWPSILIPLALIGVLIGWQLKVARFNLAIFLAIFSLSPAVTPFATELMGFEYFTMLNYDLQQDQTLKIAATLLISSFVASLIFGASIPLKTKSFRDNEKIIVSLPHLIIIFAISFWVLAIFLEAGNIVTQSYGTFKVEGASPYSSIANQFFNACVALYGTYLAGRGRRIIIFSFYVCSIFLFLVIARRTLFLSLIIILIYSVGGGNKLGIRHILFLLVTFVLLVFIGEIRSVGLINYITGTPVVSAPSYFFSLPGGASNIFVGTMGVIDMIKSNILFFPETYPILLWGSGTYESTIYASLGYQYNGGMHIANILYWNFGLLGVILGGAAIGWIAMRVHSVASRIREGAGGTLPAMLSFGFILVSPNFIWYHPIGLINLSFAIVLGFIMLYVIKRAIRVRRLPSSWSAP